ncbi:MAG: aminoacyl-tRNA hydrolase [Clostridia bacterium]|nr:aminoacyl-tRNA hydrolase [Clostridia bacterium]MBO7216955.1 aminoacyl-tRNA hydrolase [Clostridia bacterium]MBO7245719.1 aminoacyl-tRNA hydrolase [Clostridia bacterium]MBO7737937.1 aminoacyl-tRNA hydrolase [Clostridia bacterium]
MSLFSSSGIEYIIVGLGNPEPKYDNTRHNAGFRAIDRLAENCGARINSLKHRALCGKAEIAGKKVLLLKPQTYMNHSGEAVKSAASFYKVPPAKVIVLFDDCAIGVGELRIRRKGSAGGHNGIKSLIEHLGTQDFPRVKIGVGEKPHPDYDMADWVLSNFSQSEFKSVCSRFDDVSKAVELIVSGETDKAMNLFN